MATQRGDSMAALGEQTAALAEQLGRIAGTLEGTAESWLARQSLTDQLARVRDGASEILERLAGGAARGRRIATGAPAPAAAETAHPESKAASRTVKSAAAAMRSASSVVDSMGPPARPRRARKNQNRAKRALAAPRRADLSRAPGKRRRKPTPSKRGVKKSNEMIAKSRTAAAVRRRRKYEGRGTRY